MSTASTVFPRIQSSQLDGYAQSFRHRQGQFHHLYESLTKSAGAIKLAILADSVLSSIEVDFEYGRALSELRMHYESLDIQKDLKKAHQVEKGVENFDNTRPVGIVYIVPSTWTLTFSVLSAWGAAVAAGCCVVLELPETLTQISAVLRKILTGALDPDTFAIAKSRPPPEFTRKCMLVNQTDEKIDPSDWSQVLVAPSTSGAMAVVDRKANIDDAAQAVANANFGFGGKSAYAPQIILVNEFVANTFISGLISRVARDPAGTGLETKVNGHIDQVREDRKLSKDILKIKNVRTVASGSNGIVLEVFGRHSSHLTRKPNERTVVVHRISSLDDALSFLKGQSLAACFVFAEIPEANYLSRHTNSYISTINYIPAELLVGPVAPAHSCVPFSPSLRYSTAMFKIPAPQYLRQQNLPRSLTDTKGQSFVRNLLAKAMEPLPPMVQGDGHQLNFFGQSIFVGFGMAVTTIIGVSVGSLWLVFGRPRGKWFN